MQARELRGPKGGRLWNSVRFLRDPYRASLAWRTQYGDPFLVRGANGDVVLTGRADHVKTIFGTSPEAFEPFGTKALVNVVGRSSLLVLSGEAHRRERKLLMPAFHGERMKVYAATMCQVAARHLDAAVGSETTMQALAQRITLEIIVRAIFGVDDPSEVGRIQERVLAVIDALHPSLLFIPWLQRGFGGLGPYARFRRQGDLADKALLEAIAQRRMRGAGDDLLGLMLAARYDDGAPMRDEEIRDELRTLVVAGHETSAMTFAFLVDFLFRAPSVVARARRESLDSDASSAHSAPYLTAVVKETLRLRPIVTEVIRTLRKPLDLGDVSVPAGWHVSPSIVLAHYDPERYPSPDEFRPERFLERTYGPLDWLPFGGGHRRCIGVAFAEMELRIVLATLLRRFDVTLMSAAPPRPVRRNLTMGPHDGVPVRITRREPIAAPSKQRMSGSTDATTEIRGRL